MTIETLPADTGRDPPSATGARVRRRSGAPGSGHLDGAWWPRSDDLTVEAAELLAFLEPQLGTIHRITYHLLEWSTTPRGFITDGRRVRLDGYRFKPAHTVDVLAVGGGRMILLVVPPDTAREVAEAVMTAATSSSADSSTAAELLAAATRARSDDSENAAAQQMWASEGGTVPGDIRSVR
ncbi:DUF5994 family protein [Nocardia sp. alder85J]|uniref:DUF5994 family protein n=1 Tax=Nocardia sp. alder85J TaxID=2862949 RepID=UPI001CD3E324|nr:DUF5994 family protein [Nocardia sp. alder85J]MCX4096736.1 DUF5994 family protein [Nocardia sp. alder85J]